MILMSDEIEGSQLLNSSWGYPEIKETKESIDIQDLNRQIYDLKIIRRKREDELDNFINQTFGSQTYFGEPEQLNIFEVSE